MGQRAAAFRRPVAGCQDGGCRSGARLRRWVLTVRGQRQDESAEDAGLLEVQVTELGCGGAAAGLVPGPVVLNGEDRGNAEPWLLAAGPLLELQLPGKDACSAGGAGQLRAFGPQDLRGTR